MFSIFSLSPLFGGDAGIVTTVSKIKAAIYSSLREPLQLIRRRAESMVRTQAERDDKGEVSAIANFVKDRFHFVRDPHGIEFVKSPEVTDKEVSEYGEFIGDCDDATAYLAALLKSVGYRVELVIMAPPDKDKFSHIFVKCYLPKLKKWIALDMTAKGKPLGWFPKADRVRAYEV